MNINQGVILVGFISLILSFGFNKIKSKRRRALSYILTPLLISFILYWGSNLTEIIQNSEYRAWSGVFITSFYIGGIAGEILGMAVKAVIEKFKNG